MKSLTFLPIIIVLCAAFQVFAQQNSPLGDYKFRGIVKTLKDEVISGATLFVRKSDDHSTFVTDINGEFEMGLQPGEYEIAAGSTTSGDFRAFIKIVNGPLNPDNVVFVIDPSTVCCAAADGVPFAKPIVLPRPPYPPAALAVHASGEVVVVVKIGRDGRVISATPETGHPLLRQISLAAALGSRFEESDHDNRDVKLTYVFLGNEDEKPGMVRYENRYRIKVQAPPGVMTN